MARYEWRLINKSMNYWGLWDKVMREYIIETTQYGMEVYKKMGF